MAVRHEVEGSPAESVADSEPEAFRCGADSLRAAPVRNEVAIEEVPAPQRLAPYSVAFTADVIVEEAELASGRLVLLHDPLGHDAWEGTFRLVSYVRAELEPEIASDPLLPAVGWAWLTEALAACEATIRAPGGTVTRVASESFGAMADHPPSAQIEVRASWTPVVDLAAPDLAAHLEGWCELLCTAAGLPPLAPGVVAIPPKRARRR
jgi:Protein of unknown function (DUF3000)